MPEASRPWPGPDFFQNWKPSLTWGPRGPRSTYVYLAVAEVCPRAVFMMRWRGTAANIALEAMANLQICYLLNRHSGFPIAMLNYQRVKCVMYCNVSQEIGNRLLFTINAWDFDVAFKRRETLWSVWVADYCFKLRFLTFILPTKGVSLMLEFQRSFLGSDQLALYDCSAYSYFLPYTNN